MTTIITPGTGAGVLFTQQGVGTTPGYSALDERRSNSGSLQEGVYGTSVLKPSAGGVSNVAAADFMVTQRNAGANMSVDVNMPTSTFAFVQGDSIGGQGLYCVPGHSSDINETIAAADPTNPRVDQVILEVQDNVLDASGGNLARTRVLTGTPTGAATLTNRSGAAALPGSALLLADILVPNASSSVPNSNIRDRRKWARGLYLRIVRSAGSYTTSSTSNAVIDSTNLAPRIECSGAPLRLTLRGLVLNGTAAAVMTFTHTIDGAALDGSTGQYFNVLSATTTIEAGFAATWDTLPSAGSHTSAPNWRTTAGTATLFATAAIPLEFTVEEIVRQATANNTVTTG